MSRGSGIRVLVWIKVIQWCGKKLWVVLKLPGEERYWTINRPYKLFVHTGNGGLIGESSNLELLPEFRQIKEHNFGFV